MIGHAFLSLLNRRGVWMTAAEIFDASPDYPLGDYVLSDLEALKANGLIATRRRAGSSLTEYGLPSWVDAPRPALTPRHLAYLLARLVRQALALAQA